MVPNSEGCGGMPAILAVVLLALALPVGEGMSPTEAVSLANSVCAKVLGETTDRPTVSEVVQGKTVYFIIEQPGLQVVVDGSRARIRSITRDVPSPNRCLGREDAVALAGQFTGSVLGYVPEGTVSVSTKGPDCYPHWKLDIVREENGVLVGPVITIWIWGVDVVNYICSDIIDVDSSSLAQEPCVSEEQAVAIAKGALPGILRQMLDSPQDVSLGYSYSYVEEYEETTPGLSVPVLRKESDDMYLRWAIRFDDRTVYIDALDGSVMHVSTYWRPHNWMPEVVKMGVIGVACIIPAFLFFRLVSGSRRSARRAAAVSVD